MRRYITYNAWMTRVTDMETSAIVKSYDFSRFKVIVDVGGGEGKLLFAVLGATPDSTGILFDLPNVAAIAKNVDHTGLDGRCVTIGGDFFESVPSGGIS